MSLTGRLASALVDTSADEAARILEGLRPQERVAALRELDVTRAAAALQRMDAYRAADCLARWPEEGLEKLISSMPLSQATRSLAKLGSEDQRRVLDRLSATIAGALRLRLRQPEGSAGSLMDPNVATVPLEADVGEARRLAQRQADRLHYYVYVVGRDQRLAGVLNLRELMSAPARQPVAEVMKPVGSKLKATADRETILAHPGWRDHHALPVVGDDGSLLGLIRYGTLRQLEADARGGGATGLLGLAVGLGEIYWSAAASVMWGAMGLVETGGARPSEEARDDHR